MIRSLKSHYFDHILGSQCFLNDSQFLTKFWDQDIDQICEQVNKKLGKRFKRLGKGETGWAEFIFLNECETACITFACVHLSWNSESLDVDCFDSKDLEFRGLSCWIAQFSKGGLCINSLHYVRLQFIKRNLLNLSKLVLFRGRLVRPGRKSTSL